LIGHALSVAPTPVDREAWDRWIATGFAVGSALDGLSTEQANRLVWAPDFVGSACFLVSGALAYRVATGPHLLPSHRQRSWTAAAVNLAGCVFFGISAVASYNVPSTGSILDLAASNWSTALGALCFFIGALLALPRRSTEDTRSTGRRIATKEV
jgi:hypothetical protein